MSIQCYHCGDHNVVMDESLYMLCKSCALKYDLCTQCASTKPRGQLCRCQIEIEQEFIDPMDLFWGWVMSLGPITLEINIPGMNCSEK